MYGSRSDPESFWRFTVVADVVNVACRLNRESPRAVFAAVKAMQQSVANRKPPPRDAFLCFVCRDTCMCGTCATKRKKAAALKAKEAKAAFLPPGPASERPKVVRTPKPPKPKSRTSSVDRRPSMGRECGEVLPGTEVSTSGTGVVEEGSAGDGSVEGLEVLDTRERGDSEVGLGTGTAARVGEVRARPPDAEPPEEVCSAVRKRSRAGGQSTRSSERSGKLTRSDRSPAGVRLGEDSGVNQAGGKGQVLMPSADVPQAAVSESARAAALTAQDPAQAASQPAMAQGLARNLAVCQPSPTFVIGRDPTQDLGKASRRRAREDGKGRIERQAAHAPAPPEPVVSVTQAHQAVVSGIPDSVAQVDLSPTCLPEGNQSSTASSRTSSMTQVDRSPSPLLTEEDAALFPWMTPDPLSATLHAPAPGANDETSAVFRGAMPVEGANSDERGGSVLGNKSKARDEVPWETNGFQGGRGCGSNGARKVMCTVGLSRGSRPAPSMANPATPVNNAPASVPMVSLPSPTIRCTASPASGAAVITADVPSASSVTPKRSVSQDVARRDRDSGIQGVLSLPAMAWKTGPPVEARTATPSLPSAPGVPPAPAAPVAPIPSAHGNAFDSFGLPVTSPAAPPAPAGPSGLAGYPMTVPPSPATTNAVLRAQAARARAVEAAAKASKATIDMMEAKSFSDRNNKAAMWRVQEATKLKDKLLGTNDVVSGFGRLRRNAEREVVTFKAAEAAALGRLREAEGEIKRLKNGVMAAHNGWMNGSALAVHSSSPPPMRDLAGADGNATRISANGSTALYTQGVPAVSMAGVSNGMMGHPAARASSTSPSPLAWDHAGWWRAQPSLAASPQTPGPAQGLNSSSNGAGGCFAVGTVGGMGEKTEQHRTPTPLETAQKLAKDAEMAAQKARKEYELRQATIKDLTDKLARAEAGRVKLVRETQMASDHASKASAAAMHHEDVAREKTKAEQLAREEAAITEWEAQRAELEAQRSTDMDIRNASRMFLGTFGDPRAGTGAASVSGVPAAAATAAAAFGPADGIVANGVHMKMVHARNRRHDVPSKEV